MKAQIIIEALDLTEAQINSEQKTVRQRIIASGLSKNRRQYREEVLQGALPLFEGVRTFANHPGKSESKERPERSILDMTGWIDNVVYENGALYGTRHFANTDAGRNAWALVEQVVSGQAPASLIGASINAVGKASKAADGDYVVIESIDHVLSVDDVTTPAAGGGFMVEGENGDDLTELLVRSMTYEQWFESRPDYTRRLQNEMKQERQDGALKAAKADAEQARAALESMKSEIEALRRERDAALGETSSKGRELALERALRGVGLPQLWETDLRDRLLAEADVNKWPEIVETERTKARQAGAKVSITGAGQQVAQTLSLKGNVSPLPRADENVTQWLNRTRRN